MIHVFECEQVVIARRDDVFRFFEDPRNLSKISPPSLVVDEQTADYPPMSVGLEIAHPIRWFGLSVQWRSRITEYDPPRRFVDEQIRGPYRSWRHEHSFEDAGNRTLMRDRVQYELPFGILGEITRRLVVARQLRSIFDYRARRVAEVFLPKTTDAPTC